MRKQNLSQNLLYALTIFGCFILLLIIFRLFHINIPFLELKQEIEYVKKKLNITIGVYVGNDPFHLKEPEGIANPVLTSADVTDIEAEFVADPFMVVYKNKWYMFFEVMNMRSGQGDIGLATSPDGLHWEYQKIILDEPFHLSYPQIFLDEDTFYMIPESNRERFVNLYKAVNFPFEWQYEKTLLSGLAFTDSTIFTYDQRWWLFSETNPEKDDTLRLFSADALRGPWKEHPQSPLIQGDENIARPGGRILQYDEKIFRVAQDDWPLYGNQVRIFQITRLSLSEYIEHEICETPKLESEFSVSTGLIPPWRSDGIHHLDAYQTGKENWIVCVDGLSRNEMYKKRVLKFSIPFTRKKITSNTLLR